MQPITRTEVWDATLRLLEQLSEDWDYDDEITGETWLFSELGFQSLDAVVLGNTLQERFGRPIPFADLLVDIGQRPVNDVTVDEWVDFTTKSLQSYDLEKAS
ncbi:MAG: acyl carrier protein [Caldilineales bacterium]